MLFRSLSPHRRAALRLCLGLCFGDLTHDSCFCNVTISISTQERGLGPQYSTPTARLLHLVLRPREPAADGTQGGREVRTGAALQRLRLGVPSSSGSLVRGCRRMARSVPAVSQRSAAGGVGGGAKTGGEGGIPWGRHPGRPDRAIPRQGTVCLWVLTRHLRRGDRKSTRLNSSHRIASRMPSSA